MGYEGGYERPWPTPLPPLPPAALAEGASGTGMSTAGSRLGGHAMRSYAGVLVSHSTSGDDARRARAEHGGELHVGRVPHGCDAAGGEGGGGHGRGHQGISKQQPALDVGLDMGEHVGVHERVNERVNEGVNTGANTGVNGGWHGGSLPRVAHCIAGLARTFIEPVVFKSLRHNFIEGFGGLGSTFLLLKTFGTAEKDPHFRFPSAVNEETTQPARSQLDATPLPIPP